jgi:hypothetical protein
LGSIAGVPASPFRNKEGVVHFIMPYLRNYSAVSVYMTHCGVSQEVGFIVEEPGNRDRGINDN